MRGIRHRPPFALTDAAGSVVDELPRGIAEDGEAGLAQTSVALTLMGKRLRRDYVDEVGVVDA